MARDETSRPRWPAPLKWGLFAVAGSLLAWRIVTLGMADQYAEELDDPADALRGAGRAVGAGRSWMQKSLVIGQVAVSLVLALTSS